MPRPLPATTPHTTAESADTKPLTRGRDFLFAALLLIALFLAYRPAWHGGFVWDDDAHVTRAELRSWEGLGRIWTDVHATQQYYPVLHSAFWVQHRWFGDQPAGYHAVTLALHALNALLLVAIVRRLGLPGAWFAAAIFALHPVMVESVAWITELKNTLSGAFYLGAALAYLRFDRDRQARWYALAATLFLLALGTKTVTATLPGALLVIFWWQRGTLGWRHDVLPLAPFFAIGAASGLFTAWVEANLIGAAGPEHALGFVERCLLAGRVVWFYLGKILWPADLSFVYPRWQVSADVGWQWAFPLAALATLLSLWGRRRRTRGPLAGALIFVGTLFPVLGFFNIFPFLFSYVADHFQYLASLGVIVSVAAGATLLARRLPAWAATAGALAVAGLLALLTHRQSRIYRDAETLYTATLARNPQAWLAHLNLGLIRDIQRRSPEAITHYRAALAIKPDSAIAHANLGLALAASGSLAEGVEELRVALRLKPDYSKAHYNLGIALLMLERPREALPHFAAAVRLNPGALERGGYGRGLLAAGKPTEAAREFEAVLALTPNDAEIAALLQRARTEAAR